MTMFIIRPSKSISSIIFFLLTVPCIKLLLGLTDNEGLWDASSFSERNHILPLRSRIAVHRSSTSSWGAGNDTSIVLPGSEIEKREGGEEWSLKDRLREITFGRIEYPRVEEDGPNLDSDDPQSVREPLRVRRKPSLRHPRPASIGLHEGHSRIPIPNTDEYTLAPLPSLNEAFARLHPLLQGIKSRTPNIPMEHDLTSPIFPPFLTDDLKKRFKVLQEVRDDNGRVTEGGRRRYYLTTTCRNVAGMLADWFAAWTVMADYLGPETLVFSILEGDSADGSDVILAQALRLHLLYIGVPSSNINIQTSLPPPDWAHNHRIALLAELRNKAMAPFYSSPTSPDGHEWTAVVFFNDVYLGAAHFLEVMSQHVKLEADMTCGWDHAGKWFYDGWVGRDMSGDLFTPFPVPEEEQHLPQKLFPSSPMTKERHKRLLPYQVFSAWNGIAVLSPTPFQAPYHVRFRRGHPPSSPLSSFPSFSSLSPPSAEKECQASESSLISWDFWKFGFGRVAVVPGVHACYGKDDAMIRGRVEFGQSDDWFTEEIEWIDEPPAKIRCHDWPDKPGKGWWAWDSVRWIDPPELVIPETNRDDS